MTDETGTPAPESPADTTSATAGGPGAGEAWNDVVVRMGDLAEAISRWAKAAADSPDNQRRLDQMRAGFNDMTSKADAAFSQVAASDLGQQVRTGAEQAGQAIGETAQKVSDVAAPHVASAFAGLASAFGRAAAKVDEAASRKTEAPPAPAEPVSPTDAAEAPAAPADPTSEGEH